MKRLSNISPFILLLVPVFFMMILAFAAPVASENQNDEMAIKASKVKVVNVSNVLAK
jgi:hypothetical protein